MRFAQGPPDGSSPWAIYGILPSTIFGERLGGVIEGCQTLKGLL
jgi:hypothetical protein